MIVFFSNYFRLMKMRILRSQKFVSTLFSTNNFVIEIVSTFFQNNNVSFEIVSTSIHIAINSNSQIDTIEQKLNDIQFMIIDNVQNFVFQFFFFDDESVLNDEEKYQRFKKIEKKTNKIKKMIVFKKKIRLNGFILKLFIRFVQKFVFDFEYSKIKKLIRAKKYFDIIKFSEYKKNSILELKKFIRDCELMFDIKFVTYRDFKAKINFVKFLMNQIVSKSNGVGQRHKNQLNLTNESSSIGKQFCEFFKKKINFVNFRIININNKLHEFRQRSNQTIVQLIAYLKILKGQGSKKLFDSIRANYLYQFFHEYIKTKLNRKKIDMNNRRKIEKMTLKIEIVEQKSSFLRKKKKK